MPKGGHPAWGDRPSFKLPDYELPVSGLPAYWLYGP